ncbi:WD40 repeat domain-containing protein [Paenactinomyces guangxiensis]|uniref:WD40 repeat domain-containing protein n=1 Tax=Paenactinomyces guangxiensis TaxID=1490290 RepID=A0A7W1WNU0_9BACL|nr:WD40 repeat domain-containing protein [Paenactinomyces guangxiensis]MBA4493297.1 WD40 repeat domain-containing protein [Paenactinomyces guangxiensis]MBH8589852.1 WD40 repeat domain-containing protein [Paenactinomyces guangxiensis]
MEDLGQVIPGESFIWRITTDEGGRVYGGTYPSGKVFQYNPETNTFRDYGQMVPGQQYVRSITFGKGKVYAGTGTASHIVKLDPESGEKKEIPLPPDSAANNQFVYDLDFEKNLLFARLAPSKDLLVYDLKQKKWVDRIADVPGLDVSSHGPENKVYFVKSGQLYSYDLKTRKLEPQNFKIGNARGFGWIHLDGPEYPGPSLISITFGGDFWTYNPITGKGKWIPADIEGQPVEIQSLGQGPDGNIYVGGYLNGGLASYNPAANKLTEYKGIGQIEGMKAFQGKLYMGVYSGADIYSYDPGKSWNMNINPVKHMSLKSNGQNRPFAMTSAGDQLAIGTVPDYGQLGGALTTFAPQTGGYEVHRNIVQNQSVISLNYRNGLIYGGTSVWGGLGVQPTETEAKLFIWDPVHKVKVWEGVPISGEKAISALTFDADGNLWGLTAGKLFKFDTQSRQVVLTKELFPVNWNDFSHYWREGFLTYDEDGHLYGTARGKLFKVDPQTLEWEVLVENAYLFAEDRNGDFYFSRGSELFKYDK